jgi:hypothetical protein
MFRAQPKNSWSPFRNVTRSDEGLREPPPCRRFGAAGEVAFFESGVRNVDDQCFTRARSPVNRGDFFADSSWQLLGESRAQKNLKLGHFDALDVGGIRVRQSCRPGVL